jgi:hypothetical protein
MLFSPTAPMLKLVWLFSTTPDRYCARHRKFMSTHLKLRYDLLGLQEKRPSCSACDCLHDGHATRFSPIGLLFQVFGSARSPVAMGLPLTGQRIITRAGGLDICFMAYLTPRPSKPRTTASTRSRTRAMSSDRTWSVYRSPNTADHPPAARRESWRQTRRLRNWRFAS